MGNLNSNTKWFFDKIYLKGKHGYWDECASSHFKVDNCVDALRARGIKKDEELKSLVLSIGRRGAENRFYVFHLLSDEELDNRAIERHFKSIRNEKINKIRMAEPEELQKEFSAMQGTITPVNRKIWNAYTFISPRLLPGRIVSTNDGTVTFAPQSRARSRGFAARGRSACCTTIIPARSSRRGTTPHF